MTQLSKVLKVVCWAGSVRSDLPKIDGYYYPPVSGLHPSISGRVGTVTYVKIGCKFETVASKLEAEASICSVKIEQVTRHITVHNVYYPECDGEGEWLKYHSDSHCLVAGDFNQHSVPGRTAIRAESLSWARASLAPTSFC